MAENLDILNAAVSLLVKAVLPAARFSGRVRKRSLKRLAAKDGDAKAEQILFLEDRVYQLEMQLRKHLKSSRMANVLFPSSRAFTTHINVVLAHFALHPDFVLAAATPTHLTTTRKDILVAT